MIIPEKDAKNLVEEYPSHEFIKKCAVHADMNYPSRKYMEDGNFHDFPNNFLNFRKKGWIMPKDKEFPADEAFFVVLDGHGGTQVMEFCEKNLYEVKLFEEFLKFRSILNRITSPGSQIFPIFSRKSSKLPIESWKKRKSLKQAQLAAFALFGKRKVFLTILLNIRGDNFLNNNYDFLNNN